MAAPAKHGVALANEVREAQPRLLSSEFDSMIIALANQTLPVINTLSDALSCCEDDDLNASLLHLNDFIHVIQGKGDLRGYSQEEIIHMFWNDIEALPEEIITAMGLTHAEALAGTLDYTYVNENDELIEVFNEGNELPPIFAELQFIHTHIQSHMSKNGHEEFQPKAVNHSKPTMLSIFAGFCVLSAGLVANKAHTAVKLADSTPDTILKASLVVSKSDTVPPHLKYHWVNAAGTMKWLATPAEISAAQAQQPAATGAVITQTFTNEYKQQNPVGLGAIAIGFSWMAFVLGINARRAYAGEEDKKTTGFEKLEGKLPKGTYFADYLVKTTNTTFTTNR